MASCERLIVYFTLSSPSPTVTGITLTAMTYQGKIRFSALLDGGLVSSRSEVQHMMDLLPQTAMQMANMLGYGAEKDKS